jgi:hypothetical protein
MSKWTENDFNELMEKAIITNFSYHIARKRIILGSNKDLILSVQASFGHYCSPRDNNGKFYETWEIGFPSKKEDLLMTFIYDGADDPTQTVYSNVPTSVLIELIEKYGGICYIENCGLDL